MIGKQNEVEKPVSIPEVNFLLRQRSKEGELGYEQNVTLRYTRRFLKTTYTNALKIMKDLEALGLDKETVVSITNILPEKDEAVKLLLPKDSSLSDDQVKEIVKIVKKYKAK